MAQGILPLRTDKSLFLSPDILQNIFTFRFLTLPGKTTEKEFKLISFRPLFKRVFN